MTGTELRWSSMDGTTWTGISGNWKFKITLNQDVQSEISFYEAEVWDMNSPLDFGLDFKGNRTFLGFKHVKHESLGCFDTLEQAKLECKGF